MANVFFHYAMEIRSENTQRKFKVNGQTLKHYYETFDRSHLEEFWLYGPTTKEDWVVDKCFVGDNPSDLFFTPFFLIVLHYIVTFSYIQDNVRIRYGKE